MNSNKKKILNRTVKSSVSNVANQQAAADGRCKLKKPSYRKRGFALRLNANECRSTAGWNLAIL